MHIVHATRITTKPCIKLRGVDNLQARMPQQRISLSSGITSTMGGHYRHLLSDKRLVSPFYSHGFRKLGLGHMTEQQFADGCLACYHPAHS